MGGGGYIIIPFGCQSKSPGFTIFSIKRLREEGDEGWLGKQKHHTGESSACWLLVVRSRATKTNSDDDLSHSSEAKSQILSYKRHTSLRLQIMSANGTAQRAA